MKRVRSIINIVLGSLIAALGLTSCERSGEVYPIEKYGSPYADTTVHCMYGVSLYAAPAPDMNIQTEDEDPIEEEL